MLCYAVLCYALCTRRDEDLDAFITLTEAAQPAIRAYVEKLRGKNGA